MRLNRVVLADGTPVQRGQRGHECRGLYAGDTLATDEHARRELRVGELDLTEEMQLQAHEVRPTNLDQAVGRSDRSSVLSLGERSVGRSVQPESETQNRVGK